jgi:hypothetical protein
MNDDELKSLLRDAEAGIERPNLAPGDLAGRVRGLDRRRRRRTRMLLGAAPLTVLGALFVGWSLWPKLASVKLDERVASVAVDYGEIERLQAEAEFHERMAREMIAGQQRGRAWEAAQEALTNNDPLDDVREQIDVVAYRMVQRADALRTGMDPPAEAIRVYREVDRLFPDTHSAELARMRLSELGTSRGET